MAGRQPPAPAARGFGVQLMDQAVHAAIALTMNTYAHVLEEAERAAMDDAARRLFG